MELCSNRLCLRECTPNDVELLMNGFNDPDVIKFLGDNLFPFPRELATSFLNYCIASSTNVPRVFYNFIIDSGGKGIGEISLAGVGVSSSTKPISNYASFSYWLLKKYWGQGVMEEALDEVIRFSFNKLELDSLQADVANANVSSCKLLERKGFKIQEPSYCFVYDGKYCRIGRDSLYALFRDK